MSFKNVHVSCISHFSRLIVLSCFNSNLFYLLFTRIQYKLFVEIYNDHGLLIYIYNDHGLQTSTSLTLLLTAFGHKKVHFTLNLKFNSKICKTTRRKKKKKKNYLEKMKNNFNVYLSPNIYNPIFKCHFLFFILKKTTQIWSNTSKESKPNS